MTCYKPIPAFQTPTVNSNGKRPVYFTPARGYVPVQIPCGQCIGCRLERSRQWAIRCVHEASLYTDNCFITLTFDDDHLLKRDNPRSLDKREFQLFMKRLRFQCKGTTAVESKDGITYPIRFYHCGEYGELYGRPHYHAILFNYDFPDKILFKTLNGHPLYVSKILGELWPYGFSSVGSMTFESAAYVARYIMKKQTGDNAEKRYAQVDLDTGEYTRIEPEYNLMSRRPGIAARWYDEFESDVYPDDFVVLRNKKMRPPKYYDRLLERTRPYEYEQIKLAREVKAALHCEDQTDARLKVRESVKLRKLANLPRNLDKEDSTNVINFCD